MKRDSTALSIIVMAVQVGELGALVLAFAQLWKRKIKVDKSFKLVLALMLTAILSKIAYSTSTLVLDWSVEDQEDLKFIVWTVQRSSENTMSLAFLIVIAKVTVLLLALSNPKLSAAIIFAKKASELIFVLACVFFAFLLTVDTIAILVYALLDQDDQRDQAEEFFVKK